MEISKLEIEAFKNAGDFYRREIKSLSNISTFNDAESFAKGMLDRADKYSCKVSHKKGYLEDSVMIDSSFLYAGVLDDRKNKHNKLYRMKNYLFEKSFKSELHVLLEDITMAIYRTKGGEFFPNTMSLMARFDNNYTDDYQGRIADLYPRATIIKDSSDTLGIVLGVNDNGDLQIAWKNGCSDTLSPFKDVISKDNDIYRDIAMKILYVFYDEDIFLGIRDNKLVFGQGDDIYRFAETQYEHESWKDFCNSYRSALEFNIVKGFCFLDSDELELLGINNELISKGAFCFEPDVLNAENEIYGTFDDFLDSTFINRYFLGNHSLLDEVDKCKAEIEGVQE